MNALTGSVARIMFGLPFGIFGILHFMNAGMMVDMVPFPGGVFWVYLTGVAFLAASISILIEKQTRLACILLGVMFLIFILTIRLPGIIGGELQLHLGNLLKDLALAGGAWLLAGSYTDESDKTTTAGSAGSSGSAAGGGRPETDFS